MQSFDQFIYFDIKEGLMTTSNQLISPYTVVLRLRFSQESSFTCILWAQKCLVTPIFLFAVNLIGFFHVDSIFLFNLFIFLHKQVKIMI
jgi:hypothetical protein